MDEEMGSAPRALPDEYIGVNGALRVHGQDYDLRQMAPAELQALHGLLATDADLIRDQLARVATEGMVVGKITYEQQTWRNRARFALRLKKKQMLAIHTEFTRRKDATPALSGFCFPAVLHVYGEDGLARVQAVARSLLRDYIARGKHKGRAVSARLSDRQYVCGDKIRHADEESALAQIEEMAAGGQDVSDLKIYPCPWCKTLHVGNDARRKKRRRARDKARQNEEQAL